MNQDAAAIVGVVHKPPAPPPRHPDTAITIMPTEIPAAIERLRAQSVVRVGSAVGSTSSSSTISAAFIGLPAFLMNIKFWRTAGALLLGQVMSACLCATGVSSQLLVGVGFNAPAAQNFLNYFFLAFVYGAALLARQSETRAFADVLTRRGLAYAALALIDVEANFLIVYAYQYTNITSIQLLNCFTIPVVMLLSWIFLAVRYLVSHIIGVAICLLGVAVIIANDAFAGDSFHEGPHKVLGDLLCLCATVLYGTSNVSEEFLIKQNDRTEYLGMVGLFGCIISGLQLAVFESGRLAAFAWTPAALGYYALYTAAMFIFYSLVSLVMEQTSALMFNLSVLTASFYSLIAGIWLFDDTFQLIYLLSFGIVLIGSSLYSARETRAASAQDRRCLCRVVDCCCPWAALCCADCGRPPRTAYTVTFDPDDSKDFNANNP